MDGQWSFKRLLRNAQRVLGQLGQARAAATSTKEHQIAKEAAAEVHGNLQELADDLGERAEYVADFWGRDPMPWADHVARQEALQQRQEVLALLDAAEAQLAADSAPAEAPTAAAARPAPAPGAQHQTPRHSARADPREAELQALRARLATGERQTFEQQAIVKAQALVRQGKAFPAEFGALVQMYAAALQGDQRDAASGRVALIDGMYAARPAHGLFGEQVPTGAGGVLESGAIQGLAPERRHKLLSMTPTGQAVLAQKQKGRS